MGNRKIFFSKKGSGYILGKKPLHLIIYLFFLTFTFLIFSFTITTEVGSTNTIPDNVETTVLISRFLNSPDCFAYQDEDTGRVYTGIIDLEKFNEATLEKCYFVDKDGPWAFKLTLESFDSNELSIKRTLKTSNWGARRFTQSSQYVIIRDKKNLYRGTLFITTQK